ncbi:hydroxymethylpyrimidine kinase/phosphomethylpyrimidine kinase [Aliiruegeria lutimaris]|uniref:Hydroxymethylpyrimidine kinase/phosphomethylpyrimidine kinase n=1 Tax=Aliiruegeria lutimaris TaxID=571298 RepID=A0A1G8JRL6_9RHOB|nr:hydroxymethylpyrimidine kinase/phosphomethylpyrimidine kinase [Aliiruegeria lutimaris]
MKSQGLALLEHGPKAVFMKGGHLEAEDCPDLLIAREAETWLDGPRFDTKNTHGTGCSISSAIAAELARGKDLAEAVTAARRWLQGAIAQADSLGIGHGHGPTHHFHALWPVA